MDQPARRASSLAAAAVLVVIALAALALRLHAISAESIWLDEAYTHQRAAMPVMQTIAVSIERHHNPTYFVFMHYWIALGDDELWLRLPSALFGAFTAAAACGLGILLGGLRVGFVAGALLALSPVQVYFGQEARMYTMVSCVASVAMLGLLWLGMHPEQACRPVLGTRWAWRRSSPRIEQITLEWRAVMAWLAYALGTLAALYLHNTGVFFGAAVLCAAVALLWGLGPGRLRFAANFVAVNVVVLAVFGLYLRTLLGQAQKVADNFWDTFPTLAAGSKILRQLYLLSAPLLSPLGVLLLASACAGLWTLRQRKHLALGLLSLALVGPALILLVSLHTPIFGTRLMLWVSVPFAVLIALGAGVLRAWPWQVGYVALVAALCWPTLERGFTALTKEPWRAVLSELHARALPDARIVVPSAQEQAVLEYYFQRRTNPLPALPVVAVKGKAKLEKRIRGATQLWLVDRKRGERTERFRQELSERGGVLGFSQRFDYLRVDEITLGAAARR